MSTNFVCKGNGALRTAVRVSLLGSALWLGYGGVTQAACTNSTDIKRPLFGDLHVHTSYSLDAYGLDGTRNDPWDAYAYAKGIPSPITTYNIVLGTLLTDRSKLQTIDRPLDFAAVTDHDGFLNSVTFKSKTAADNKCSVLTGRQCPQKVIDANGNLGGDEAVAWNNIKKAANDANDPCYFTSFVAYEWTKVAGIFDKDPFLPTFWGLGSELHRNVIFRTATVPNLPITTAGPNAVRPGATTPSALWTELGKQCKADITKPDNGCQAITIPHNSNLSNGFMFPDLRLGVDGVPLTGDALTNPRKYARLQREYEPVMEIIQNKGASECIAGTTGADEDCAFEERNIFDNATQKQKAAKSYARQALGTGMALYASSTFQVTSTNEKINPYRLGFIGSTDTHNATPGAVIENGWNGHQGGIDSRADFRLLEDWLPELAVLLVPDQARERLPRTNPGGLAVVWAKENTRDAIFAALQQREVYATSGPRITLRMFGGWNMGADACGTGDQWIRNAYANRSLVPMGGELSSQGRTGQPRFAISVMKDPGAPLKPGANLQQIDVIKGWIDANGTPQSARVWTFGGAVPLAGDTVLDTGTCKLRPQYESIGFASDCKVFTDYSWNQNQKNVYYYARVMEVPSCRWSRHDKLKNPGLNVPIGIPDVIHERAWSSPIWFTDKPQTN